MIRSFLTVSTGTLASRLLGFLRDSMIAALLGTGAVADAFLVAFQFVNVVRRLLTVGARFAGRVLGTVGAALFALAVLIGLLMPLLITALAPGFAGQETLRLAV